MSHIFWMGVEIGRRLDPQALENELFTLTEDLKRFHDPNLLN